MKKARLENLDSTLRFLNQALFFKVMSEDNDNVIHLVDHKPSEEQYTPKQHESVQCKIIQFPFDKGKNDLCDGIGQYHLLFEYGFDFLYGLLEKRGVACQTFPNHCGKLHNKDITSSEQAHYLAALMQFESLVTKIHLESQQFQESNISGVPALQTLTDARVIECFRKRFDNSRAKFLNYHQLDALYNPELRVFGEGVYESSRCLQTMSRGISEITSLLLPSNPIETQAEALEDSLSRISSDQDAIKFGISQACQGPKEWVGYITQWFHILSDYREEFFNAWNQVVWNPVKRVYTAGVLELELVVGMNYRTVCEQEGRMLLGLEYFERILEKLSQKQPVSFFHEI